jgi:hypothetical protein
VRDVQTCEVDMHPVCPSALSLESPNASHSLDTDEWNEIRHMRDVVAPIGFELRLVAGSEMLQTVSAEARRPHHASGRVAALEANGWSKPSI